VHNQQTGTAAIVSRAAARNWMICAWVTSGNEGIVVGIERLHYGL
jgi:hypothetical protein